MFRRCTQWTRVQSTLQISAFRTQIQVRCSSLHARVTQKVLISRVPQCLSPRPNWDPKVRRRDNPVPSPSSGCAPPPEPKGGGHTRLRVREVRGPNSDDWRKSLALLLLCNFTYCWSWRSKYIHKELITYFWNWNWNWNFWNCFGGLEKSLQFCVPNS